jgi:hypothetical protein
LYVARKEGEAPIRSQVEIYNYLINAIQNWF